MTEMYREDKFNDLKSRDDDLLESTPDQASVSPDPFNPESLRLDPSYADTVGVKKLLVTVPVRKPNRDEFVRVHPDRRYRLEPAALIELKAERETYILTPQMAHALPDEFSPAVLYTAISRQGVLFLWPVKLPGIDGRENEWHRSARDAAGRAMSDWVRIRANMSLGAYELFVAKADLPEPEWPEVSFNEILQTAFRERYVDNPEHPLIRRLRGEA
jgi:hypothetical protein